MCMYMYTMYTVIGEECDCFGVLYIYSVYIVLCVCVVL